MTTTTTIHVHNNVNQATSNQILLFLQPVAVSDNYLFSAWNVLNPGLRSWQSCVLSTSISASVAAFASTRGDYTDPVALAYGEPLLVTNANNQGPTIGGNSKISITTNEVGLDNECTSPPTDLSVTWYVNGSKVVETNNTDTTSLNPGFDSTFQLKQSVWLMFGQRPTSTKTYTVQTFSTTTEIQIPNGATDLYIEAYTGGDGVDTFKAVTKAEFEALTEKTRQKTIEAKGDGRVTLEKEGVNTLVIVAATFTTALTIAAVTYLTDKLISKFSGGLKVAKITATKDKLEVEFQKAGTVLALLGMDMYETAVDNALLKAAKDADSGNLKDEKWTFTESISVLYQP